MTVQGPSEVDAIADLLDRAAAVHEAAGRPELAARHRLAAARVRPVLSTL